jgi:sec-independent protein translocase protein TatA
MLAGPAVARQKRVTMFREIGTPELLIVLLVAVLLFGGKKLPEVARGMGRGIRLFRAELKAVDDGDVDASSASKPAAAD